jgi:hypothetical protein
MMIASNASVDRCSSSPPRIVTTDGGCSRGGVTVLVRTVAKAVFTSQFLS